MQSDFIIPVTKTIAGIRMAVESVIENEKGLERLREILQDLEIIERYKSELKRGKKAEQIKTELSLEYFNTCQLKKIEYILYHKY